ncbi:pyridine nucleotide-disulfide oxidoreductase [Aureimonas endophytica]|uniref:Pyridine nucleotide-disulfide oxidoreductase n=1 Tax=Aureimonas endophytica TaxID=2027858 RepID=A0A917ECK0_9HYPH|nr:FAD-dependent oxidoreductase [Aureimonas endophytica]GGE24100.1 pyridine nucleotide-disulfide oxidoreductase [Aureimonas endophytica]
MERVVIVGAGQAGLQVAVSLRQGGFAGSITLVGDEDRLPYQRPPLSKAYLQEDFGFERLALRPDAFFADQRIEVLANDPAVRLDRPTQRVSLRSGRALPYDRLALATGARNRRLAVDGADLAGVHMLRGAADAEVLRTELGRAERLLVIGGGFIGLEVAASARGRGLAVTVLEAGPRLMGRVVSPPVSDFFLAAHRAMGTTVLLDQRVLRLTGTARVEGVETAAGFHAADLVLVAVGVEPRDELAQAAGLDCAGGIRVDRFMVTSDPAIFAIGDCAVFESRHARGPVRLESVQNAVDQAKCVASVLLGEARPYDSVPWFWSDQGGLKLQIAGLTAGADHVHVADGGDGRLVAYSFRGDDFLGIETVNRPGEHMAGRRLLAADFRLARDEVARHDFDLKTHLARLGAAEGKA